MIEVSSTLAVGVFTVPPPLSWAEPVTFRPELKVTGSISTQASVDASASRAFQVIYNDLEAGVSPSSGIQKWPLNIYDKNGKTLATIKYIKEQSGRTQFMLADLRGEESSHFASLIMGHNADGTGYMATYVPASFGSDVDVSGDLSVIGDVDCEVLKGKMLYVRGAGGAHIVRQITDYTKGQAPSNSMYIGHFLYGSGVTNQTSNRVAGNEIAINSSGNVTYTFSCYEPVAGSTKTTTLRLGYGDESWINLDADNVNLASTVNVNGALNVNNNDVNVKGWIRLTGNIESSGTQPFKLTASSLDVKASPASNIQLWPLGVYDKNGLAAAYIKYNKYTDGRQNIQLLSRYVREDDTYDLTGLTVGHHADGTFYTDVPHPVTSSHFLRSKLLPNSVSSEVRSPCAWHKGCSSSCAIKSPWLMENRDSSRHCRHNLKNSHSMRP